MSSSKVLTQIIEDNNQQNINISPKSNTELPVVDKNVQNDTSDDKQQVLSSHTQNESNNIDRTENTKIYTMSHTKEEIENQNTVRSPDINLNSVTEDIADREQKDEKPENIMHKSRDTGNNRQIEEYKETPAKIDYNTPAKYSNNASKDNEEENNCGDITSLFPGFNSMQNSSVNNYDSLYTSFTKFNVEKAELDKNSFDDLIDRHSIYKEESNTTKTTCILENEELSKQPIKKSDNSKTTKRRQCLKEPSDVLTCINFCISHYNIFDDTVFRIHLPILISYVLENYESIDEEISYEFLKSNLHKVIFEAQNPEVCSNFFELIDSFYYEENAKIKSKISTGYKALISKGFTKHLNERNYTLYLDFYKNNKGDTQFSYFVERYYEWMVKKPSYVIQQSICLFENTTSLNGDLLFKELWSRFCYGVQQQSNDYGTSWDQVNTDTTNISISGNSMTLDIKENENKTNKKQIAMLIYEYNKIFNKKYERLLTKKANEANKKIICMFLNFILGLQDNDQMYFYNMFFLINTKISSRDPTLISLIKSIHFFDLIFSSIIKKVFESGIRSENYFYIEKPNISQIKNIIKLTKNMIQNSQRFKSELNLEFRNYDKQKFDLIIGEHASTYKNILFEVLIYFFLCEMPCTKKCKNSDSYESTRHIKIQCMRMIETLIDKNIITSGDLETVDFKAVIAASQRYKNDPSLVLPIGKLIKLKNDTYLVSEYASLVISDCFYYFDFISALFSFDAKHVKVVLPNILERIVDDDYSFMICHEILLKMLEITDADFNWATITKFMIEKFLYFFDRSFFEYNEINAKNQDVHTQSQKTKYAVMTSEALFNSFSGYFIEYLIQSQFSKKYIEVLSFKEKLYGEILNFYTNNPVRTFKFLMEFETACSKDQLLEIYKKCNMTLYQITNYRTFTDTNTLLYLLKVYNNLPNEHTQFLSIIYQVIAFIQRSKFDLTDMKVLIDFLSQLQYNARIKSSLQTYLGFYFNLIKKCDKTQKSYLTDTIITLIDNPTITIKKMLTHLLEYLDAPDFFTYKLKEKSFIYKNLVNVDINIMDEFLYKLESSFFVSQVSDINNKCDVLKKISFFIFTSEYNKFSGFNSKLIELCVNLIQHNSIKVRKSAWFLVKILCMKMSHYKLVPLFPVIFTEILYFINNCPTLDNPEYPVIMKLIDLLFLLNSNETFEFRNNCLGLTFDKNTAENSDKFLDDLSDEKDYIKGTQVAPLFSSMYKELRKLYNKPQNFKLQITTEKTLFFQYKDLNPDDIMSFIKYSPAYYLNEDIRSSNLDVNNLENFVFSEFYD